MLTVEWPSRRKQCFVLDDGTGKAVGYVLGCPDVFAFVAAYRPYVDQVLASDVPPPAQLETQVPLLVPRPLAAAEGGETEINPECLVQWAYKPEWVMGFRDKADMLEAHRATLHIDLLPEFQRQGWGRKLVDLFVGSIRQSVRDGQGDMGRGVHLFIGEENKQVVDFYQKCGFRLRDGGDKRTYWLVKDVDV